MTDINLPGYYCFTTNNKRFDPSHLHNIYNPKNLIARPQKSIIPPAKA
jgi:hypothetical protein